MTDSTLPDDTAPVTGRTGTGGGSQDDDDRVAADGPTDEPGEVGADTPGAPSSAEPMTTPSRSIRLAVACRGKASPAIPVMASG